MSRILLLSHDFASNAVWTPVQFAGALRRAGHEVDLAGPARGPLWPPLARELATALRLPGSGRGPAATREIEPLARECDAVYAFKAVSTSLGLALDLRRRFGMPLLLHLDDRDAAFLAERGVLWRLQAGLRALGDPVGPFALHRMERRIADVDALTVSTRALANQFGGSVVRQGVDEAVAGRVGMSHGEARTRLGLAPDDDFALFLGSPVQHKGLAELEALVDRGIRVRVVGAGPERLREAGLDDRLLARFDHAPPVDFDDAGTWIRASTVFVVPQRDTPFARYQLPAKLLHAMMLGRAIVTTDVADARVLLDGDRPAGVVVPAGDAVAFADAVRRLVDDPGARAALESEARRRAVAEFGWTAMGRALDTVLREAGVTETDR